MQPPGRSESSWSVFIMPGGGSGTRPLPSRVRKAQVNPLLSPNLCFHGWQGKHVFSRAGSGCLFGKQRQDEFGAGTLGAESAQKMLPLYVLLLPPQA